MQRTEHAPPKDNSSSGLGLCLLSLDGGGVRGLSSLLILKKLMESLDPDEPPKPCDYFDLIGGTSTGGLIALMLGRLRMSIDECIEAYKKLSPAIFSKLHHRVNIHGRIQGRFDHQALENGVKDILAKYGFKKDELLKETSPVCRTFVCATSRQTSETVVLSSYYSERRGNDIRNVAKIWEVARATSAASSFFDPIEIGGEGFVDGATGANNPINEVWMEASDIWSEGRGWKLEENLKCLISIGTGKLHLRAFGDSLIKNEIGEALVAISTNTERVADTFEKQNTYLYQHGQAFRFNVEQGLENVGLEDAQKLAEIESVTRRFIQTEKTFISLKSAAARLKERAWIQVLYERVRQASGSALQLQQQACDSYDEASLQWFVHTTPYVSWSRSGGVLWYKKPVALDAPNAVTHVALQASAHCGLLLEGSPRILYYQCGYGADDTSHLKGEATKPSRPKHSRSSEILQALAFQALNVNRLDLKDLQNWINGLRVGEQQVIRNLLMQSKFPLLDPLFEALELSVRFRKESVIVTLDDAEHIESSALLSRLAAVAARGKFRLIVSATPNQTIQTGLAGADIIDNDTEYRGKSSPGLSLHVITDYYDSNYCRSSEPFNLLLPSPSTLPPVFTDGFCLECLQTMHFEAQNVRMEQIALAEPGTIDWLWNHQMYLDWQRRQSGILWIEGKPGSGKSVLAKAILQRLPTEINQKQAWMIGHWFYSTRGGQKLVSHESLLRSILQQLLKQGRDVFHAFEKPYRRGAPGARSWWSSNADLVSIFDHIARSGAEVTCIIDAMDESQDDPEYDQSREGILSGLTQMVSDVEKSRIKLVILSRPFLDIDVVLSEHQSLYGNVQKLVLENENMSAIIKIVDSGIHSIRRATHRFDAGYERSPSRAAIRTRVEQRQHTGPVFTMQTNRHNEDFGYSTLRDYILEHARGVVLWVKLIVNVLEKEARHGLSSLYQLERKLRKLPLEIDNMYRHIVQELGTRLGDDGLESTRRTLMWISGTSALHPFTLEELRDALAVPGDFEEGMDSDYDPIAGNRIECAHWTSFVRQLRSRCGPFVEILSTKEENHEPAIPLLRSMLRPALKREHQSHDTEVYYKGGDVVQLLHRTAKDFFAAKDAAGPLSFTDAEAADFVRQGMLTYLKLTFPKVETYYAPLPVAVGRNFRNNIKDAVQYLEDRRLLPFIMAVEPYSESEARNIFGPYAHILDNLTNPPLSSSTATGFLDNHSHQCRFLPQRLLYGDLYEARSVVAGEFIYEACSKGFRCAVQTLSGLLHLTLGWAEIPGEAIIQAYCLVGVKHQHISYVLEAPSIFFPPIAEKVYDTTRRGRATSEHSYQAADTVPAQLSNYAPSKWRPRRTWRGSQGSPDHSRSLPLNLLEVAAVKTGNWRLIALLYCARYHTPLRGHSPFIGRGKGIFNRPPLQRSMRSQAPIRGLVGAPALWDPRGLLSEKETWNSGTIRGRDQHLSPFPAPRNLTIPRAIRFAPTKFIFETPAARRPGHLLRPSYPYGHTSMVVTESNPGGFLGRPRIHTKLPRDDHDDTEDEFEWDEETNNFIAKDLSPPVPDGRKLYGTYYPVSLVYGIPCDPADRFSVEFAIKLMREARIRQRSGHEKVDDEQQDAVIQALAATREFCVQWWRRWGYSAASPRVIEYEPAIERSTGHLVLNSRFETSAYASKFARADGRDEFFHFLSLAKMTSVFRKPRDQPKVSGDND